MKAVFKPEIAISACAAALLGLLWIVGPPVPGGALSRLVAASPVVMCSLGAGLWFANRRARAEEAVRRALEELCRSEPGNAEQIDPIAVAAIDERDPWRDMLRLCQQVLGEERRALHDAEHARARAEVRLRRLAIERDQLAEVLAGLPDPVVAIDHFDDLVLANQSAEKLFSIRPQPAEQRAVQGLLHCQQLVDLLTQTRRRKTPACRSSELAWADDTGETHWYRITCRNFSTPGGEHPEHKGAPGAVAVLSDISPQRAIQKRHAEFVSAASHEMKTPLAGIKAYVELLADGDAEDEATREEFLAVINSQADRLQRLIDNLLNMARIEAGVVQVLKQPQPLNALLAEALEIVRPAAEAKQIELVSDLSPLYLGVLIDRDMILQATINLLSNAVKYTPEAGHVALRSRLADETITFEVQDTGVGLSTEDAQRVFEKFYRVKKDSQMAPGTGLGLPLARHIVEDVHGGKLTVESKLGQGSTFRVSLPVPERLTS